MRYYIKALVDSIQNMQINRGNCVVGHLKSLDLTSVAVAAAFDYSEKPVLELHSDSLPQEAEELHVVK